MALACAVSLVNIAFHYLCSYIGLSFIPSSRGTVLESSGSFFLILLSCALFPDDRLTRKKAVGCVLGFSGILVLSIEPGRELFANLSLKGDGMILLNAVCAAFGGIISKLISRKTDMTFATGISMTVGGSLLCILGLAFGIEHPWYLSAAGIGMTAVLVLISAISFQIYNKLLAYHPISTVAIYNAFIPVLGIVFSCALLGEPFSLRYMAAGILVAAGIVTMNSSQRKSTSR